MFCHYCYYHSLYGYFIIEYIVMNSKKIQLKRLLKILIKVIIILIIVAEIVYLIKYPVSSRDDFHLHI